MAGLVPMSHVGKVMPTAVFPPRQTPHLNRKRVVTRVSNYSSPVVESIATKSVDELANELALEELAEALAAVVRAEDYKLAAKVRDAIKTVQQKDPLVSLELELELAVKEERFGDAALLRDQLRELQPPPPPTPEPPSTSSTRVTEGIRVTVQASYLPGESRPENSNYLFAYRIKITNESHPTTVKLMSRMWVITDSAGRQREVNGQGVVGQFPELAIGESFEYQSGCPLNTNEGSMEGHFEFYSRTSSSESWNTSFLVYIARFGLTTKGPKDI
jgi:ApaG protein